MNTNQETCGRFWVTFSAFLMASAAASGCGIGVGAEESSACQAYEEETCRTDQACASSDPCSLRCDRLQPPRDEAGLQRCVENLRAITIPDPIAQPMENAFACVQRSHAELVCLGQFLP